MTRESIGWALFTIVVAYALFSSLIGIVVG